MHADETPTAPKPFTSTVTGERSPIIVTGQAGSGKTTVALSFASALGANITYKTTSKFQDPFVNDIQWDDIDAVVIDEIDGFEIASMRAALPSLFINAKALGKGVILVGQDVSRLSDIIPAGCTSVTPTETHITGRPDLIVPSPVVPGPIVDVLAFEGH